MGATESIREVLRQAPEALKAGDISEILGLEKKEVDKAIKKMLTEGVIISPKRCFYELKK